MSGPVQGRVAFAPAWQDHTGTDPRRVFGQHPFSGEPIMEKDAIQYVLCAHCEARIPLEDAIRYEHRLLYGEHFHCRECDPGGVWDCMSHDTDMEVH
jgi:hypothetical protein